MSDNTYTDRVNVEKLQMEISSLKDERERLSGDAQQFLEERSKYNEEFKRKREAVKEPKERRDALNTRVKELKSERDSARREASAKRQEIKKTLYDLSQIKVYSEGRSQDTSDELEHLEWMIQTTSMSKEDERSLMSRIAELEAKLQIQLKNESLKSRLNTLREDIKKLDVKAETSHRELIKLVDESEIYHNKMIELSEESNKIRLKADKAHKKLIEVKNRLKEVQDRYIAVLVTFKSKRKQERETRRREEEAKLKKFKNHIEETATGKLRRKEKLSFEEFKILIEKGMI